MIAGGTDRARREEMPGSKVTSAPRAPVPARANTGGTRPRLQHAPCTNWHVGGQMVAGGTDRARREEMPGSKVTSAPRDPVPARANTGGTRPRLQHAPCTNWHVGGQMIAGGNDRRVVTRNSTWNSDGPARSSETRSLAPPCTSSGVRTGTSGPSGAYRTDHRASCGRIHSTCPEPTSDTRFRAR